MKLAVKFSSDSINIAELKTDSGIHIQKCIRGKMPEGAFLNGIVINTSLVAEALRELLKEHKVLTKKAILCVSGIDIIHKEIKIPKSAKRHIRGLLKNELTRTDTLKKGYLFDFIPGEENGTEELSNYMVYQLPAELIRNYEQTLKRAGLIMERIEPISRSMEKLSLLLGLEKRENLTILVDAESSALDILMTGSGMKSVYRNVQVKEESIEENVFIVSAIQNIAANTDPLERVQDQLVETISRLIQFQSQKSRGRVVDQILVYGGVAEKKGFIEKIGFRTGIRTELCQLPANISRNARTGNQEALMPYSTFGAVCGKLVGEKKQLAFTDLLDEAEVMTLKDRIPLFAGLVCLVAFSVFYAVMATGNNRLEQENEQKTAQIENISNSEEYLRRKTVQEKLTKLVAYNENCKTCISVLEQTEQFSPDSFIRIDALVPEGIAIIGYEYEGNTVRFSCTAANQDGPADFARIVSNAGVFEKVDYTGFSAYREIDSTTYYSFQLECSR